MERHTQINLHNHTLFSDGTLTPLALAEGLASAGVAYAALTDHDSIDGLAEFQAALRQRQIGFIPGLELTTFWDGTEIHLLAYGFDPNHAELSATLHSLRQSQDLGIHSIAASMRKSGLGAKAVDHTGPTVDTNGQLAIQEGIALIHRAGGLAFLAHPFAVHHEIQQLAPAVAQLKSWGLDGLEVFYGAYSAEQRNQLQSLAHENNLLMSGGTDVHTLSDEFSLSMPTAAWKQFRDAVMSNSRQSKPDPQNHPDSPGTPSPSPRPKIYRRRYFILRILLPTILAIALFITIIWGMILPSFENILLERKRELIRELTNTAFSILASLERDERSGKFTQAQAQSLAIAQIEALRYGRESKDYFWLQDMHPRIIMHPYRKDLDGQDVSQFADPRGVFIFVEFSDLVRRKGEGYIEYVWQWKDDPQRLEAKESYIKGFEPWGWVIGTGIYIEDVHQEITRIETNLVMALGGASGVVILLLAFIVQQSLRIEKQRREIESSLHDSTERYRSLIEATTEGTLLVLNGHCRYANPKLMSLLNLHPDQLELMDLADILPHNESNAEAWNYLDSSTDFREFGSFQGVLQRSDGSTVECVLALNPISSGGLKGFILLAKEITVRTDTEGSNTTLAELGQHAPVGLFRAKAVRRGVFFEANVTTRSILNQLGASPSEQPALADLFHDDGEFDEFFNHLLQVNFVDGYLLNLETIEAATLTLSLSARLERDIKGLPTWVDGTLQDVTAAQKEAISKNVLIEKLQTSLLFLQEPVSSVRQQSLACSLETPIHKVAALMTGHNASAILIQSESGAVIGMVTDHDLRARVLSSRMDLNTPVWRIMSAPLVTIKEDALIYEALMLMEDQGMQYLAVEDKSGQVVGIIRSKELVQFHRYGSIILTREITQAETAQEIATHHERIPTLVRALVDSGGKPRNITYMLSTLCDATTERLIQLATRELGAPPVDFAFIAMGSQGRQEQTLLTDQDNAIIYASSSPQDQKAVDDYFARLGGVVCDGLAQAGYTRCRGQFMASQPKWRADLSTWKTTYANWIQNAEPQELLNLSIFFDFRPVFGNADLTHELRRYIFEILEEQPAFFPHLAQNALTFRPPSRLAGKIYFGSSTEHGGQINLKDATLPVVNFARLYALKHHIAHTNTLGRLDALVEKNVLTSSSRDEITLAFEFLMKLRLQQHVQAAQAGVSMENNLNVAKISHLEDTLLQQAFTQISAVQKKITFDFLGGR